MIKTLDMVRDEYRDACHELWCVRRALLETAYSDDLYTFGYMSFDPNNRVVLGISHVWDDEAPGHELEETRFNTMNEFFFKGHNDARFDHMEGLI